MPSFNALTLSHSFMKEHLFEGAFCIDATAGRGKDTLFLAQNCGTTGKVLAFDIQREALDSTASLLAEHGMQDRVSLILDSHSNLEQYAAPESADLICFNFGWLPGGDHNIFTRTESSIAAIDASLRLLKNGGVMSLCIYYGKNNGYEERDAILAHLKTIDPKAASVLVCEFVNRGGDPAIPVFVLKGI